MDDHTSWNTYGVDRIEIADRITTMKLKYMEKAGVRASMICGPDLQEYAHAGTDVTVLGRAAWAEKSMGDNKILVQLPNGKRIVVNNTDIR